MRKITILAASMVALLLFAGRVAASSTVRWTDSHDIGNSFSCGVVEDTTAWIDGTAYFAADGTWLKDVLRFSYFASYSDPATGRTIESRTRQTVLADPEALTFVGQGLFVRAPGAGAVMLDVGRLTVDRTDGSTTFKSANAVAIDDPTAFDRYDTAICGLFYPIQ